jgi:phage terminase small subunit
VSSLTDKQQRFVDAYLECWNASEAARRAGYKGPRANQAGQDYLSKPDIRAAIDARLAEHKMGADEVLARLSAIAHGGVADFVRIERVVFHPRVPITAPTPEDPKAVEWVEDPIPQEKTVIAIDLEQARDRGKLHLLKKYKESQWGPEVETHDPVRALELLGKHHRLFAEQVEVSWRDQLMQQGHDPDTIKKQLVDAAAAALRSADRSADDGSMGGGDSTS